jgi:hypothetical protein
VFAAICGDATTYAGSKLQIVSRTSMAKAAFNKKTFDQQTGLKLKEEN